MGEKTSSPRTASCYPRSGDKGGGDQDGHLSDHCLQGRLRTTGGDQLERRRRQQRLSCEADRHGSRRRDLNRGRKTGRRALARRGLVSWYWAELRLVSSSLTPITIRIAEH